MISTHDLFENLKDILSKEVEGKVFDCHVADAISMTEDNVRQRRRRNSIPFEEVLDFCKKRDLNPLELFYETKKM
jgi:hypothetical protein